MSACGRSTPSQPSSAPSVVAPSPADGLQIPAQRDAREVQQAVGRFRDVAAAGGIEFSYYNAAKGRMHLRETMGGGVGMIDFDGDGVLDLFFTDGCDLPRDPADRQHRGRLFRGQGSATFADVTEPCGIVDFGYGQGCAVGDVDNDGFDDLFVTQFGGTAMYFNLGDGTFRDGTSDSGVHSPLWNTACAFGDLTGQGVLDLFVTGYLEVGASGEPICRDRRGNPAYCGPEHFPGQSFRLFQNCGDSSFADRSVDAGVVVPQSKGLAATILDLDEDGRLDVFVVNDAEPARLFGNRGALRFEEVAMTAGLAYTGDGQIYNGMGIATGDFDGDGRVDLSVSNFYEKGAVLFRNRGNGRFRDESVPTGLGSATRPRLSFGLEFLDVENDGWLDLFLANGHISDLRADGIPYAMRAQLFQNTGNGRLREISATAGDYFNSERLGRGVAVGDLDNDGSTDIVVSHNTGPASVLRNESLARGHFLRVELVGTVSSRTAVGARLTISVGDRSLVRVLAGGGSYLSASDRRLLFGLGESERVTALEVEWPSGHRDRWGGSAGDQMVRIVEGASHVSPKFNWPLDNRGE